MKSVNALGINMAGESLEFNGSKKPRLKYKISSLWIIMQINDFFKSSLYSSVTHTYSLQDLKFDGIC